VAGDSINATYIAQQVNNTTINLIPSGQSVIDPSVVSQLAQLAARLAVPQDFSARVCNWETEIQRLLDEFDRHTLSSVSLELETWFNANRQWLSGEDRARCLVLLARIQLFFDGQRDAEVNP